MPNLAPEKPIARMHESGPAAHSVGRPNRYGLSGTYCHTAIKPFLDSTRRSFPFLGILRSFHVADAKAVAVPADDSSYRATVSPCSPPIVVACADRLRWARKRDLVNKGVAIGDRQWLGCDGKGV
jgi:hypothetical protein